MTIKITQTCEKCGRSRDLKVGLGATLQSIGSAAEHGGWRDLKEQHVCDTCINVIMANPSWRS